MGHKPYLNRTILALSITRKKQKKKKKARRKRRRKRQRLPIFGRFKRGCRPGVFLREEAETAAEFSPQVTVARLSLIRYEPQTNKRN